MHINFLAYNFCQKLIIEINPLAKSVHLEPRKFWQRITTYRASAKEKVTLVDAAIRELKNILAKSS